MWFLRDHRNPPSTGVREDMRTGRAGEAAVLWQRRDSTLFRWRQDELFHQALEERHQELWSEATQRLRGLVQFPNVRIGRQSSGLVIRHLMPRELSDCFDPIGRVQQHFLPSPGAAPTETMPTMPRLRPRATRASKFP